jgi:hypothetical protein
LQTLSDQVQKPKPDPKQIAVADEKQISIADVQSQQLAVIDEKLHSVADAKSLADTDEKQNADGNPKCVVQAVDRLSCFEGFFAVARFCEVARCARVRKIQRDVVDVHCSASEVASVCQNREIHYFSHIHQIVLDDTIGRDPSIIESPANQSHRSECGV